MLNMLIRWNLAMKIHEVMVPRVFIAISFAVLFLISIPACIHAAWKGLYKVNEDQTFYIGPISSTLPFVFLALLFLAHCIDLKNSSHKPAYICATISWMAMMSFTSFLLSQEYAPPVSSTTGVAVVLTPFFYIPFLFVPYFTGLITFRLWQKR
jgi:hypothetical protein